MDRVLRRSIQPAILPSGEGAAGECRSPCVRRRNARSRPRSAALGLAGAPAPQAVPPTAGASADAAIAALHEALAQARGRLDGDPYANPIALLALDLEQKLGSGVLDEHAAAALIQRLTREAFAERAAACAPLSGRARPRAQSREHPSAAHGAGTHGGWCAAAVRGVRRRGRARLLRLRVHRASDLRADDGAADHAGRGRVRPGRRSAARADPGACRAPDPPAAGPARSSPRSMPSRSRSSDRSAPSCARSTKSRFDVARELYPDDWRKLRPRLLTLATWVGYDTDGRADIGWTVDVRQAADGAARPARALPRRDRRPAWRARRRRAAAGAAARAARGAPGARDQVGRGRSRGARTSPAGRMPSGASGWPRPPATWSRAAAAG